ncbi:DUF4190 domain-containing protein, partial [Actinotalea sp. C106]|uniref:DUF4190 domain-containing protein n=1 Tax=Actinotalea sp. C106 TaxID=2908644 RepID=UPI0020280E2D
NPYAPPAGGSGDVPPPPPGYGPPPGFGPPQAFGSPPVGYGSGYPAPGHPGQGYGAPGYSGAQHNPQQYLAQGWATPPPPTEGLAVASLVLGIIGVVIIQITGPVAVVLGIVALVRIRRLGRRGQGLAIAGLVTGGFATLLLLLFGVFLVAAFTDGALNGFS